MVPGVGKVGWWRWFQVRVVKEVQERERELRLRLKEEGDKRVEIKILKMGCRKKVRESEEEREKGGSF